MVATLKAALATDAAIVSVKIDGTEVRYDRQQALRELSFWETRAARENGTRPVASQIRLDSF